MPVTVVSWGSAVERSPAPIARSGAKPFWLIQSLPASLTSWAVLSYQIWLRLPLVSATRPRAARRLAPPPDPPEQAVVSVSRAAAATAAQRVAWLGTARLYRTRCTERAVPNALSPVRHRLRAHPQGSHR